MARWYICTDYSSILNPIPACMHNPSYQHIMRGYTPQCILFENLDSSAHNGTIATTAKICECFCDVMHSFVSRVWLIIYGVWI